MGIINPVANARSTGPSPLTWYAFLTPSGAFAYLVTGRSSTPRPFAGDSLTRVGSERVEADVLGVGLGVTRARGAASMQQCRARRNVRFVLQPPSGTVTFLFTDVEGSTRRWQDEPEAMRARLGEHDASVRRVIEKHHGHVFKHTGDGVAGGVRVGV